MIVIRRREQESMRLVDNVAYSELQVQLIRALLHRISDKLIQLSSTTPPFKDGELRRVGLLQLKVVAMWDLGEELVVAHGDKTLRRLDVSLTSIGELYVWNRFGGGMLPLINTWTRLNLWQQPAVLHNLISLIERYAV